jgi:hypothetical protein
MINRTDWQSVSDALIADDRAKLGEPPTADELLAYERGELSSDDAARVQQLLVAYPELARAYATPFPSDDEADLPAEVIDRQWNAFRGANKGESGTRVLQFWRGLAAIAATVAIALGALLWHMRAEQLIPHVLPEPSVFTPEGGRGLPGHNDSTITPSGDRVLLVLSLMDATDYETYRLDLIRSDSRERIWSSDPLPAPKNNSFNVEIPSRALRDGTYQMIAYGLRGNAREQIATYTIEVRRPAAP